MKSENNNWEIKEIVISAFNDGEKELEEALLQGWQPFQVDRSKYDDAIQYKNFWLKKLATPNQ